MEKLRWGKTVKCPYCASSVTKPTKSETGRHACRNCKRSFTVFVDTVFEDTGLPLPKWFIIIGLMLNSKSGMSAKERQRNIGCSYKSFYYAAMRVRIGMLEPNTKLGGMIEMDESYFGGKARKKNHHGEATADLSSVTLKRGRGTNKVSVAAMVERKGRVKSKVIKKLTKRNLL
ncbi:MAG: transposase-like protein [Arcticibacterium sp.]|jgi:transposase-like protein